MKKTGQKELKLYTGLCSDVVYNKPDLTRFNPYVDGSAVREKYFLGEEPIFLSVGVISPVKGAHLLIQAFKLIKKCLPDAKLIIVGKHTYGEYSRQLSQEADESVIFAGYVPDEELPKYYSICDVYTTCSLWEAHNVPVLEAQACGKPIVAFNFNFFQEELGKNDILVEEYNIEEFANACVKKYKDIKGNL